MAAAEHTHAEGERQVVNFLLVGRTKASSGVQIPNLRRESAVYYNPKSLEKGQEEQG